MEGIKVQLDKGVEVPKREHSTDSGLDLVAHSFKQIYTHTGGDREKLIEGDEAIAKHLDWEGSLKLSYLERVLIGTGVRATVGAGYELQVRPRSGNALKKGLTVLNTPGTIDEGYRNEIGVILVNLSRESKTIKLGDKIAQLVACPVCIDEIKIVDVLPDPESDRDQGGFGSTGERVDHAGRPFPKGRSILDG